MPKIKLFIYNEVFYTAYGDTGKLVAEIHTDGSEEKIRVLLTLETEDSIFTLYRRHISLELEHFLAAAKDGYYGVPFCGCSIRIDKDIIKDVLTTIAFIRLARTPYVVLCEDSWEKR